MSNYNEDSDVKLGRKLHRVMMQNREDSRANKIAVRICLFILMLVTISIFLWMNGVTP